MNSQVPHNPESDNYNSKSGKPVDMPLEELKVESTSDYDYARSQNDAEDIVDVAIEPEAESKTGESELINSTVIEPDLAEPNETIASTVTDIDLDLNLEDTELLEQSENTSARDVENTKPPVKTVVLEDSKIAEQTLDEPDLFVDSWLDEPNSDSPPANSNRDSSTTQDEEIKALKAQNAALQTEIKALKTQKEQMLLEQVKEVRQHMAQIVEEGTKELIERRATLQIEIEKLERRRDRINKEMRANFAGSSQELAVKVKGFKEYLVGSLQDLASAAEKLELSKTEVSTRTPSRSKSRNYEYYDDDFASGRNRGDSRGSREVRSSRDNRAGRRDTRSNRERNSPSSAPQGQFSEPTFADQSRRIRQLIDKYRNNPNYYGSPWQLRRTFEAIHAKKVQDWFFVQGGRGAVDSMGSRLQNILVASAAISILHSLYGDRCRVLVLTDTPENLGEWRRGLQDCLGISRANFGSNRGVTLFDSPEVAVQRAERLLDDKLLPVIIIDETDELLNLSVLKFPLWLAFASSNKQAASNYLY